MHLKPPALTYFHITDSDFKEEKTREEGAGFAEWVAGGAQGRLFSLQARYSPQNFTDNIAMALDILHAEVWWMQPQRGCASATPCSVTCT